jgi:hypothetical protein
VAYADFPREVAVPPFRWITQTYNVVQRTEMPKGGHFAALEQPNLLLDDIRKFFGEVITGETERDRLTGVGVSSLSSHEVQHSWMREKELQP